MEIKFINKWSAGFATVKKSDFNLDDLLKEVKSIKGVIGIDDNDGEEYWYIHGGSRTAVERIRRYFSR